MNIFSKSWAAITAHKIISTIVVIVLIGGGYYTYKKVEAGDQPTQYVLSAVTNSSLITSVEGTGQVSAENQLDITPQGSGKITSIDVKQGQNVSKGQTIAVIDETSAGISLDQAKASLQSAQASYDKLVGGVTPTSLNQSQLSVQTAEQNLTNTVRTSYTQIDNLVRTDLDQYFSGPTTFSPQFQISFTDTSAGSNSGAAESTVILTPTDLNQTLKINAERVQIENTLDTWANEVSATSTVDAQILATNALTYLNQVNTFVNDIASAVDSIYLNQTKFQSDLNSIKNDVAGARTTVNSTITNIQNGEQSVANAQASLAVTTAPPQTEDVTASQISINNAELAVKTAQTNYDNNIITAPFAGEVAALNSHVGDLASGSTVVATITTPQKLAEISLNEVDVAKIAIGDKATLTFDALPNLTVSGTVAEIDTIGTVTQGVVDYTVKIALDTQDDQILPGMSVSAEIITSSESNVVTVPSSAIKTVNGASYVQEIPGQKTAGTVSTDVAPINVPIITGASNDTDTEVTSGLKDGDLIVTRTIAGTAATTASAPSATSLLGGGGAARAGGGGGFGGGTGGATRALR